MNFRTLVSEIVNRSRLAEIFGHTYGGKRDLAKALGYKKVLFVEDYRGRFTRNAVANRLVKALPYATWRGGMELVEDEDVSKDTPFELAWRKLEERLHITQAFKRADVLAGIGRYAVILIGASGEMNTPLEKATADDIAFLRPYSEEDAKVFKWDLDKTSPRFGQPEIYQIARTTMLTPESTNSNVLAKNVHWTRVQHVADGLLDDEVYGEPRLRCVWNLLDDLEKIHGGGAEAFWRRADGGNQWDLDPTLDFGDEDDATASPTISAAQAEAIKKQVDEMEHGLRKNLFTRGVTMTRMGSDVADFKSQIDSLISLIAVGSNIPQRVLMGSEQGKLAAKQDRASWDNRITDRQNEYAEPLVVRAFVDRMIKLGALPMPAKTYEISWNTRSTMDPEQQATMAGVWAAVNQQMGETVITPDEVRELLGFAPLAESTDEPTVAAKGGRARVNHVHAVADRFRTTHSKNRQERVPSGKTRDIPDPARPGDPEPARKGRLVADEYGRDRFRKELEG